MLERILDNRYAILDRVGGGGMAEVYRAHDKLLDRFVAIKILRAHFVDDDDFINRFKKEAQAAAKLSHPNIVNIYDVGKYEDVHYIVMEYVSGETLKDKLQREGTLPLAEAVGIVIQIAEALEHAHSNNLVHCDIKPHNILVTESGRVKVADFGIARAVTSSTMTYSGNVIGSVHYFSPEQARGESVNDKSDIYSLGVVMYELLTGKVPFEGETPVSVALKQIQESPKSIKEYNKEVPELLESIVLKAMEKRVSDRYINIAAMISDLKIAMGLVCDTYSQNIADPYATRVIPKILQTTYGEKRQNKTLSNKLKAAMIEHKVLIGLFGLLIVSFFIGAFLVYGKFWSSNEVAVPNLVGKQLVAAKHILEDKNLRANIEETFDDKVPAGQVVSQYPEAGAVVKEQRTITIYISKGGEVALAPDLRGLSRREAEIQLKNMGLQLGRVDEVSSEQKKGTVIDQNPRQGTQVMKGYSIDIIISKEQGDTKVQLPDFKGMLISDVENQLKELNLQKGKITVVDSYDVAGDTVIEQSPSTGTNVSSGSSVDFVIARETTKSTKKQKQISFIVPQEPSGSKSVQIVVTDKSGRRVVYENTHQSNEKVDKNIDAVSPYRVQIYINGNLIKEENY